MGSEKSTTQSHSIFALFTLVLTAEYFYLTRAFGWPVHNIFTLESITTIFGEISYFPILIYLGYIAWVKIFEISSFANKTLVIGSYFLGAAMLILSFYLIPVIALFTMPAGFFFTLFAFYSGKEIVAEIVEEEKQGFTLDAEPNNKPGYLNFMILNKQGELRWLNINAVQATMTIGGSGSGKSWSLIEIVLFQQVYKKWGIFNYDYKFPDLTQQINRYIEFCQDIGIETYDHWIVNWTDPRISHRFNIFDKRVVKDKLDVINVCTSFIVNIKKEWAKNTDFWSDAAIAYFSATALWWKFNEPDKCDLPHVIQTCLIPHNRVLPVLLENEECADLMIPFLEAKELKAGQQLAGMTGSLQIFLGKLTIPIFYWILSGNDFTVDVNDPRNPKFVSIGNAGLYDELLKPIIGTICKLANMAMNRDYEQIQREEGVPEDQILQQIYSAYNIDELSTAYLDGLEKLPNQARSKKVATHVALQNTPQLANVYGKEKSSVLLSSFGNLLVMNMKDSECGEKLSKQFGQVSVRVRSINKTQQEGFDSGGGSSQHSYTLQRRNAVEVEEFTSQATGHFYGIYTIPPNKPGEKEKKPFASGDIYTLEYPKVQKQLTRKILNDPYAPSYLKLKDKKPIEPFVKFSDSDDIVVEKQIMEKIIADNYQRIRKEVKDIFGQQLEDTQATQQEAEQQTSVISEDHAAQYAKDPLAEEEAQQSNELSETTPVNDSDDDDDSDYF